MCYKALSCGDMLLNLTHVKPLYRSSPKTPFCTPVSFLELRRLERQCEQTTCPRLLPSRTVAWPGRKPATSGHECQHVNHYATEPHTEPYKSPHTAGASTGGTAVTVV